MKKPIKNFEKVLTPYFYGPGVVTGGVGSAKVEGVAVGGVGSASPTAMSANSEKDR